MTKQTIEIEGLPEGWIAKEFRLGEIGEPYYDPATRSICRLLLGSTVGVLIVEKIQPRRIDDIDENALNEAGWAVVSKYVEIVGECMRGRLFNNLKPLLRIGITEYSRFLEVKETDISLNNDEPNVKMGVSQGDYEHDIAVMEGSMNKASDDYFKARPQAR